MVSRQKERVKHTQSTALTCLREISSELPVTQEKTREIIREIDYIAKDEECHFKALEMKCEDISKLIKNEQIRFRRFNNFKKRGAT